MEISKYFKSIINQDTSAIVICNMQHDIIYMNPTAIARYSSSGGEKLIGTSIMDCHNEKSCEIIKKVTQWFEKDVNNNIVYTYHNPKENKDVYMVALRDDDGTLIGYYEKHEYRTAETAKMYDIQ